MYEKVQPRMTDVFARVAQKTGKQPKVTYCLTGEFLGERLDDAFSLLEAGHEIGVHSHLPGAHRPRHQYQGRYAYRLDELGILNQDRVAGALRQTAIALGLPAPATHVSGMFTFQRTTIGVLEQAGFTVDCSLLPGVEKAKHEASGDFILADNVRRAEPYPYRPAADDPWADGDSSLIELPVSGNLGGGDIEEQLESLGDRLGGSGPVDVFQSFWHHFEFAGLGWTKGTFEQAERFLLACAGHEQVVFSTASQAARDLEEHGL